MKILNLKKDLNYLLYMLLVINVIMAFCLFPFEGKFQILEDILSTSVFIYIFVIYTGKNKLLKFFKENFAYKIIIFCLRCSNLVSKVIILFLFFNYSIHLDNNIGLVQYLIQEYIFTSVECVFEDDKNLDIIKKVYLGCKTVVDDRSVLVRV